MPTITVRISSEQKRLLLRKGDLSGSVREALELYFGTERSRESLAALERLQRENPIKTSSVEEVTLIREDRKR